MHLLLFTTLVSCIDMGPAIGIRGYEHHAPVKTTISGEGIINPIVCIIVFGIVLNLQDQQFQASTPWYILGFFMIQTLSVLLGAAIGFACCLLFKIFRFFAGNAVIETFFMFVFGCLAYFAASASHISGILVNPTLHTVPVNLQLNPPLAIFVFALTQSHYNWYNLSSQGKSTTAVTFDMMGKACEATCYCYMGLSIYPAIPEFWNWSLIGWTLLIIFLSRVIVLTLAHFILMICFYPRRFSFPEILFISWGGMIRGSICFALAVNIPYICYGGDECEAEKYYELTKTSALAIVIITSLVFGTFMRPMKKLLLDGIQPSCREAKKKTEIIRVDKEKVEKSDNLKEEKLSEKMEKKKSTQVSTFEENVKKSVLSKSASIESLDGSDYEFHMHENMAAQSTVGDELYHGRQNGWFSQTWLARKVSMFDEKVMRPFLIHNYSDRMVHQMQSVSTMFTKSKFDEKRANARLKQSVRLQIDARKSASYNPDLDKL
jgi:NhaP-type Na+/H+ or K+/H+ antiporter